MKIHVFDVDKLSRRVLDRTWRILGAKSAENDPKMVAQNEPKSTPNPCKTDPEMQAKSTPNPLNRGQGVPQNGARGYPPILAIFKEHGVQNGAQNNLKNDLGSSRVARGSQRLSRGRFWEDF